MPRHSDANAQHVDSKTRRKLEDQRRMQFRRAIEDHCEELRLRQELADYPEAGSRRLPRNRTARAGEAPSELADQRPLLADEGDERLGHRAQALALGVHQAPAAIERQFLHR